MQSPETLRLRDRSGFYDPGFHDPRRKLVVTEADPGDGGWNVNSYDSQGLTVPTSPAPPRPQDRGLERDSGEGGRFECSLFGPEVLRGRFSVTSLPAKDCT